MSSLQHRPKTKVYPKMSLILHSCQAMLSGVCARESDPESVCVRETEMCIWMLLLILPLCRAMLSGVFARESDRKRECV